MNELKEECMRRKLTKSGTKPKLIERLREHILSSQSSGEQQAHLQRQQSSAKSPDSGVNLDSSPSFMSCEPSPCGSVNSSTVSSNLPLFPAKKLLNGAGPAQLKPKTGATTTTASNATTSSSLDNFFEFLNVEKLGASNSECGENNNIEYLGKQLQLDALKTQANGKEESNLSAAETAAHLEMSLNEILKQLSSADNIDHLQKLEQKMQKSMQLIEKLKSQQQQQPATSNQTANINSNNNQIHHTQSSMNLGQTNKSFSGKVNGIGEMQPNSDAGLGKIRVVNSMPCNLKELGEFCFRIRRVYF